MFIDIKNTLIIEREGDRCPSPKPGKTRQQTILLSFREIQHLVKTIKKENNTYRNKRQYINK